MDFVKPVLTAVQLVPLFVERNTSPPYVPANRFVPPAPPAAGLTAKQVTWEVDKPELTAVQLVPLFR